MTRLTPDDIDTLSSQLADFDEKLLLQTGQDMLGIACHGAGISKETIQNSIKDLNIAAVTLSSGLGQITGFAQTIVDILIHIGLNAFVPRETDAAGFARAVEKEADIIFMADDKRYIAVNLKKCRLIDNTWATGNIFAAALDLMARGLKSQRVLVIGCGPVGMAAAETLISLGAHVGLHDKDQAKCETYCTTLEKRRTKRVEPIHDLKVACRDFNFLVEATNAKGVINSSMINPPTLIVAPGVPLGITPNAVKKASKQIIYDPLQLGTVAMAVMAALPD
ncbi:MAG: 3-methylornithyl-N6-L-lysine dehydrogenase PylD [Desulfobacterales bacterium]|nr:3-methylornithyl-N6-L-lysine dehydrogenase PylD [Desulfobacterales bacterium]